MKSLTAAVNLLEASGYLKACTRAKNVVDIEILSKGKNFCDQLSENLNKPSKGEVPIHYLDVPASDTPCAETPNRTVFISSKQFRNNVQHLATALNARLPTAITTKKSLLAYQKNSEDAFQVLPVNERFTHLITDHFINPSHALEKFYKIQRERKIWWMRYSSNPSRYFFEPYDFIARKEVVPNNCQSITIKSRFAFGETVIEHMTLIPLRELHLDENEEFQLVDERTKKPTVPVVIRSVINVEKAACALLFDGYDQNREQVLFLNRKLAPLQCTIACFSEGTAGDDLRDLCKHVTFVLRRAGLRLPNEQYILTNSKQNFENELQAADKLGIPYSLLLDDGSLQTGLLKLRNRDTSLEESIHISDIPQYLLSIFQNE